MSKKERAMVATAVPPEEAAAFKAYAAERGTSVNKLLAEFVRQSINGETQDSRPEDSRPAAVSLADGSNMRVSYVLWPTTVTAIALLAQDRGVPVDSLVNGVLCEFLNAWKSQ